MRNNAKNARDPTEGRTPFCKNGCNSSNYFSLYQFSTDFKENVVDTKYSAREQMENDVFLAVCVAQSVRAPNSNHTCCCVLGKGT